jgi:transcription elongation factor GreA
LPQNKLAYLPICERVYYAVNDVGDVMRGDRLMSDLEEKFILTQDGYDNIKQQLADLEADDRDEVDTLASALNEKAGGDDDDADVAVEYDARARKEWVDKKIARLRFILERAELYEDPDPDKINVGERVTLWDYEARQVFQVDVVSSAEATTRVNRDAQVKDASDSSPIGKALLGKGVGDIVEVDVPDGKTRYAVRKIEPIPAE